MASRRSSIFDNVDPELARSIEAAATSYKKHRVKPRSGYRKGSKGFHGVDEGALAMDVWLEDLLTGEQLDSYQAGGAIKPYQDFANYWYGTLTPEQQQRARWGGYFGDPTKAEYGKKYGEQDYMHFDFGRSPGIGMLAGDWKTGFNADAMKRLGLTESGALDAQMQAAGYTPEQRRAAIASIESQGSGDYAAVGPWTSESMADRDRAYGKYQVMGKNIGPWGEQYLKQSGITPEMFMADPALQDKMFDAVFGDYATKYGERGAASKWFTGSEKEPDRSDAFGKYTGESYADRYMKALGMNADSPSEGGSRFGGTGLGTPGAPAVATAPAKDPRSFDSQKMGEAMASGEGMGQMQGTTVSDLPKTALFQAPPTTVGDPNELAARKDKLARLLARLQQNTLVG